MSLERVSVVGFGCLRALELAFEPAYATVVIAGNEAGKSTLLAALETALFGWPEGRAERRETQAQFKPWYESATRVGVQLAVRGRRYRIEADLFGPGGDPVNKTRIFEEEQDVTDRMAAEASSPGIWLYGLGRDDFRRSVLVPQGELDAVAADTAGLVHRLEQVATSSRAGVTAGEARQRLARALDEYRTRADLEGWAQSHLDRAIQWSRVEPRLRAEIRSKQAELAGLRQQHDTFSRQIDALRAEDTTRDALRCAREKLDKLAAAVRRREIVSRLHADDACIERLARLDAKLASLEDVASFPAQHARALREALGRESVLRERWEDARREVERLRAERSEVGRCQAARSHVAALADQASDLQANLIRFEQALADAQRERVRLDEARAALVRDGLSETRLRAAGAVFAALTPDERGWLRDEEPRRLRLEQAVRDADRVIAEAKARRADIERRRKRRARAGGWVAGAAVGCTVSLGALFLVVWDLGAIPVAVTGAVGLFALGFGLWLLLGARQLEAYRYEQLGDQAASHQDAKERAEQERQSAEQRLASLASRHNVSGVDLLEIIAFHLAHHDALDPVEQAQHQHDAAAQRVRAHQDRWACWLRSAGHDVAAEAVTLSLSRDLQAAVAAFDRDRRREKDLADGIRGAEAKAQEHARQWREVCSHIAQTLSAAGIPLPGVGTEEGVSCAALQTAARAFDEKAARFTQREQVRADAAALRERRLPPEERAVLEQRLLSLQAAAAGESPEALLAEIQAVRPADSPGDTAFLLPGCTWEALTGERIDDAARRVQHAIDAHQARSTHLWQETRAFLRDYAARVPALQAEHDRLCAELARGEQFARAISIANQTLGDVLADGYARWSASLTTQLRPLLATFLPDYDLERVTPALSPVLVHRPSRQRLELEDTARHLSRGAKDRLFLAVRLALSRELGADRGVELPLLLDDPFANWDDQAMVEGLRTIGRLGRAGTPVLVFTCQRSRCQHAMEQLDAQEAPRLCALPDGGAAGAPGGPAG